MKTIKTALATATASGKTLDKVLLNIRSMPIGPKVPSPREILHNLTEEHPGKPSYPVNFEQIKNYLIGQKAIQKENHDQRHHTKPLPELQPGHQVLFLSPAKHKKWIHPRNFKITCINTHELHDRRPRQRLLPHMTTYLHHQHRHSLFKTKCNTMPKV